MLKKLLVMLCLLFLVVGIVSAADNNSTGDTLKTDEDNSNEIVEIQEVASDETPKSTITVNFVNAVTGEEYGSLSNTLAQGGSWGMGMGKFNNMIANHKTFKMDGYKYTFTHWSGDNGVVDSTQLLYCTGEDYTVTFYANYDKELLGRLTFIVNDEHGHNGHQMTYNDEADYKFTFKDPVDVEEGYKFLYYEHAKTGEKYNPGDVFSMLYSEFQGQDVTVEVNAIYEKIQEDEPVNDTNGTVIDNNTTDNETDTNGTAIDNSTADNETDTNGTAIDNGADDNKQVDDIDEDNGQSGNDSANSDDGNVTSILSKNKTSIAFTGLVFLVIVMISVLIYTRRNEN
ncbi:MAG: hypothetical protein E7Z78_09520 [Methanobrevibacter thaueri]|jgi:hypothetical protein|uniref:hypothetical protein n=1 Tax=Methanobrevibacter thaueri TaxID=190975 RepID=UPI0026F1C9B8|nr:hypothetical protein [Methanobrevibacter thaueri]MBE6496661.1 hypothetical protein [Methanobrevibacter thaueri]